MYVKMSMSIWVCHRCKRKVILFVPHWSIEEVRGDGPNGPSLKNSDFIAFLQVSWIPGYWILDIKLLSSSNKFLIDANELQTIKSISSLKYYNLKYSWIFYSWFNHLPRLITWTFSDPWKHLNSKSKRFIIESLRQK